MDLRYRIAVVVGGGSERGREVAVRLARAGAGVLVADPDIDAARASVELVRVHRVWSAPLQVETRDEDDVRLLAARVRDLGGAHLVLDTVGGPHAALLAALVDDLPRAPVVLDADTLSRCTGQEAISLLRAA